MKKIGLLMAGICFFVLMGCKPEVTVQPPADPSKTETTTTVFTGSGEDVTDPSDTSTGIIGDDWGYGIPISAETFNGVLPGDTLVIKVLGVPTVDDEEKGIKFVNAYSRLYIRDLDWGNIHFETISTVPELSTSQMEKEENGSLISRFQLNPETEYTITVTLSQADIDLLKEKGLKLCGPNCIVKDVKLVHTEYTYASLEEQYVAYEEYRNSIINKYAKQYDLPMIFITTENREEVSKKEYYNSIVDVENCAAEYKLTSDINKRMAGVKIRGNSTANPEYGSQMPYRIKFEKKQNMLGLHGGKKYKSWVLLKAGGFNAMDYMGFNLAHEIYKTSDYDYYASDCTFVHVFINEEYKGQYLLCEQNQVNEGRVDVDENKAGSTSEKTGYMIELDNYAWEDINNGQGRWFGPNEACSKGTEDYHFSVSYVSAQHPEDNGQIKNAWASEEDYQKALEGDKDTQWTIIRGAKLIDVNGYGNDSNDLRICQPDDFTLKNDIYSDSQVEFIQKYTKNLWDLCYLAIQHGEFYKFDENYDLVSAPEYTRAIDAIADVMDLESLCNEMILEELVRDNDVGAGSLYMAIDFTKLPGQKYNKFTFECPWDFNWGYQSLNDSDKEFWKVGKKDEMLQYFAGAWINYTLPDHYDRSHPWFVLLNNDSDIRKMLRDKWNRIGTANLKAICSSVQKASTNARKDLGESADTWIPDFVRARIDYIDRYLWKN